MSVFTSSSDPVLGWNDIQSIHDTQASNGDTIQVPDGNYTANSPLIISKSITLKAVNMPINTSSGIASCSRTYNSSNFHSSLVNVSWGTIGANSSLITINTSTVGHITLAGINFLLGSAGGNTQTYLSVANDNLIAIVHDCTFALSQGVLVHAISWQASGGLLYFCRIYATTNSTFLGGPGCDSGSFVHKGNIPWLNSSTWGNQDVSGTQNLYVEDCVFDILVSQGLDLDDNSRAVIRHCSLNNTQMLTHGTTSLQGGRQVEMYNNIFAYFGVSGFVGATTIFPDMVRWFWQRAGTGYFHDNTIDHVAEASGGFWTAQNSFEFTDTSLTRSGAGSGCQTEANYPGVHWSGTGGNGTSQIVDPVRIWNNVSGATDGASSGRVWFAGDDQGSCTGGTTANVFLLNRDIFLTAPSGYTPFTYPHPLTVTVSVPPPSQPQNLSASVQSSTSIVAAWDTSTSTQYASNSLTYDLERKTGAGSFSTVPGGGSILGVSSGQITFGDNGLNPGTNYVYEVRAQNPPQDPLRQFGNFSATSNATTFSAATAPLFVQSATDSGLPLTATYTASQTAGNANIIVIGWQDNVATVATVSDTQGNAYVLAGAATGQGLSQSIYIAKNIAAHAAGNIVTVTFTGTPLLSDLRISEYSGADLVTPLESITSSSGTTNAASCGPLVLTGTTDLLFSAETATLSPVSPGSTFTQRSISAQGNITEDKGLSTAGSFSSSFTFGSLATPVMVQHVSSGTNSNAVYKPGTGNPGNNFKFFLPNVVRSNNCVVICISNPFLAGRTITITDNIGTNTWVLVRTVNNGTQMTSLYVSDGTAAGTQRITITFDTNLYDVHIDATEFYNVATASAVDVSNGVATSATSTISAGSITTTAANDLVYQVGFDTAHLNLNPPPSITNMTNSAGFTFLNADIMNGQFVQYGIVAAVGSITPSVTLTGSTDSFNTITVALKSATAGTAPPTTGIRISSVWHVNMMRAVPMIIPSIGNLLYFATAFGSGNQIVSLVSDSVNGTWTVVPAVAGGSGNGNPQCYYRINATPSNTRTLTVSGNTVSLLTQLSFLVYDIINATSSPFDLSTSGSNTFPVGAVSFGTIVPTTPNGLVIAAMATYWDALTAETNATHTFDSFTYTNLKDADLMENVDGYAHFYNPTASSVTFTWTLTTASVPPNDTQSTEQYTIVAFKGL